MPLGGYWVLILLLVVSIYTLKICVRDFRRTRGAKTFRSYLYVLGAILSLAVVGWAAVAALFALIGPLH